MQADCRNIYQAARKVAGLTQEKAAEMIGISVRSLADYETGVRIPSNATVELMVMVYNSQLLATQHLRNSAEFARDLLPAVEAMRLPEAVLSSFDPQWASEEPGEFKEYIRSQTGWADAIVLGPGLGQEEYARTLVEAVLSDAYVPIVMDADAVNLAARYPYLKGYFTENIILTPHVLEFSRLTEKPVEEIKEDPLAAAREFSDQYGVTCVLKDAATVTARKDGKLFINLSGSPAMAKGGSGDVLTGVIAGLLAMGMDDCEAASLGVYVHGLAGEAAEKKYGVHSVLAGELAGCIGEVVNGNV